MPWQNLAEDLEEEFSDNRNYRWMDGQHLVGATDPESKRNYDRWYQKFVRYPKHRQELLLRCKKWREANKEHVSRYLREYYQKNREKRLRAFKEYRAKCRSSPESLEKFRKRHAAAQRRLYAKQMQDPERAKAVREGNNQRKRLYWERLKADPVRYAAYLKKAAVKNRLQRAKKKAIGKETACSTGE